MNQAWENPLTFLPDAAQPTRPLMILVAGMDGTGRLMHRQAKLLQAAFDVRCLAIPVDDRSSWEMLAQWAIARVQTAHQENRQRRIYLAGESFGACLALKMVVRAPNLFDRLILVNSASAFARQGWLMWGSQANRWFPTVLHRLASVGAVAMLCRLERLTAGDRQLFLQILRTIPPQTSHWRFALLREFALSEAEWRQIQPPTLMIASGRDAILPSLAEAKRLTQCIPQSQVVTLPDSGHCCLIEASVNLLHLMAQNPGFLLDPVH